MQYVELDRRFEDFRGFEDQEEGIAASLRALTSGKGMSWSELLENRFVVVLGEAGTGKTTEFKERVRVLSSEGRPSFLIPLEDLAEQQPLSSEDEDRLNHWKEETIEGYFFLDSVDEARLDNPPAFLRALRNFVRMIASSGSRAFVVVSCRASNWQFRTDPKTMQDVLRSLASRESEEAREEPSGQIPEGGETTYITSAVIQAPRESDSSEVDVKVLRMLPLDDSRIARLAGELGVMDIDSFMKGLEESDLGNLAGRPRDLEWLVGYWQEHGAFGGLSEMVELNVVQKLRETNLSHVRGDAPLSTDRAREGAEALAAASVLCSKPMIALPDPELARDLPARSFWPRDALPDWDDLEIQALLTRGVFDPATLGRVRFHDPMVRDYLAACWMAGKGEKLVPLAKIRSLVLRESFGKLYAIPSKRKVLGWLAVKLPEIRREIITVAPDVLLYCGDAKQIPVTERAQSLNALAARLRETEFTDWLVYESDVRRIVGPELACVVRELLETESESYEMCSLLLRMAMLGNFFNCSEIALSIALNEYCDESLRVYAARAIKSIGSPEDKAAFLEFVQSAENLSNNLLGSFCSSMFPEMIGVRECLNIARMGTPEREWSGVGLGASFENDVVNECPPIGMNSLLAGLLELSREEPHIQVRNVDLVSDLFTWTLHPLARLCARILKESPEGNYPLDSLAEAYILLHKCHDDAQMFIPGLAGLKEQIGSSASLRREIYLRVLRDNLLQYPDRRRSLVYDIQESLALSVEDIDWLLRETSSLTDNAELEITFRMTLDIWHFAGRSEAGAISITEAAEQSSANSELIQYVRESLNPPPREETPAERERRERREERLRAERESLTQAREDLQGRVERIRIGEDLNALLFFREQMRRGNDASNSTWAQTNWHELIPNFGENLAHAARDGFKASWRKWEPPLPYEKEVPHKVENGVVVGLTGLAIAVEEGEDLSRLPPEEAKTAFHYAMRELNGFPEWSEQLAIGHPEVVRVALAAQLAEEFSAQPDAPAPENVLLSVKYGTAAVQSLILDLILELLTTGDPPGIGALRTSLVIAVKAGEEGRARLSQVASRRARNHVSNGNEEALFEWLDAWLWIDARAAWDFVEGYISEQEEFPSSLILGLAGKIYDPIWEERELRGADFLKPDVLERMLRMVYAHNLPEEDTQSFRSRILGYLANLPGEEAQEALQRLATDLEPASGRSWVKRLAERQATNAVEYSPWSPSDVAQFGELHERTPASAKELFELTLDRLNDIKEDIERGEFSDRELFTPGMPENLLQRWLSGRLDRMRHGHYSVVREEEVDQSKKTDIRLHNPTAGLVTIEIKPVESKGRYTFKELIDALEKQLVGQYMRSDRSRYGILVIGMLSEKYWREPDGSGKIYFTELIERLNERAQEIVETDEQVDALQVIGIDFT